MKSLKKILKKYHLLLFYSESSLLLMSISFFVILFFNYSQIDQYFQSAIGGDFKGFLFYMTIPAVITVFYAFNFKKTPGKIAKKIMLALAVLLEVTSAYFLFKHIAHQPFLFSTFLAYFHLLQAVFMLFLFFSEVLTENQITDQNARPYEIIIGVILLVALLSFFTHYLSWDFEIVFSVLINYSLLFNRFISNAFVKNILKIKK